MNYRYIEQHRWNSKNMLSKKPQTHQSIYYRILFTWSVRTDKTNLWRQKPKSGHSEVGRLTERLPWELSREMEACSVLLWVVVTQVSKLTTWDMCTLFLCKSHLNKERKKVIIIAMVVANTYHALSRHVQGQHCALHICFLVSLYN